MSTPVINDIEFNNAIRDYLDNMLEVITNTDLQKDIELNLVKSFYNHFFEDKSEDFKFTTPTYGWWDLTSACNFRCKHCLYNDTEYSNKNDLPEEKTIELAYELINDFNIIKIILTGGEIFLHPKLLDIVQIFKENNVAVQLMSNGALIKDKHIDFLASMFNPYTDFIQISLDGATNETFKAIRQTDAFSKILSNIKKIISKGIVVRIACTVNTLNYSEIEDICKLCNDIGVESLIIGRMVYHNKSHESLMLTEKDLMLLSAKLLKLKKIYKKINIINGLFSVLDLVNIPEVLSIINKDKYLPILKLDQDPIKRDCHFHDRFAIRSNGKIYLCLDSNSEECCLGDYKKESLLQIWSKRENNPMFLCRDINNMGCKDCKFNRICRSGCKAQAYEKFGDINLPSRSCILLKK